MNVAQNRAVTVPQVLSCKFFSDLKKWTTKLKLRLNCRVVRRRLRLLGTALRISVSAAASLLKRFISLWFNFSSSLDRRYRWSRHPGHCAAHLLPLLLPKEEVEGHCQGGHQRAGTESAWPRRFRGFEGGSIDETVNKMNFLFFC